MGAQKFLFFNTRIISPERLGEIFHQEHISLRYTPRKMLIFPTTGDLVLLETDHNTYPGLIQGGLRQNMLDAQQPKTSEDESVLVEMPFVFSAYFFKKSAYK